MFYLFKNETPLKPASLIIQEKKGLCRDYSFVITALARANNLQARVVYGYTEKNEYHAWNEVLIDNNWISLDATWDAGYINNGKFVKNPGLKHFNASIHQKENITLH
ncbi:MAG TPA: hypothetical protein GX687_07215 [Clostridia bacterium]|nr:hypothetical protein [Clostridia bacterium]